MHLLWGGGISTKLGIHMSLWQTRSISGEQRALREEWLNQTTLRKYFQDKLNAPERKTSVHDKLGKLKLHIQGCKGGGKHCAWESGEEVWEASGVHEKSCSCLLCSNMLSGSSLTGLGFTFCSPLGKQSWSPEGNPRKRKCPGFGQLTTKILGSWVKGVCIGS